MVTLKGSLTKQFPPQSHGERRVYFLICFPLRRRKTNNNKPSPIQTFYSKACPSVHRDYPDCHHAVDLFFSVLPALWNAEPIPLGSAESKKKITLCALCLPRRSGRSYWGVSAVNDYLYFLPWIDALLQQKPKGSEICTVVHQTTLFA